MTAEYGLLDFTSMTATEYKNGIDNNSVVGKRFINRFAPHAQTTPNMTVRVEPGDLFDGKTLTEVAAQDTGTITAPASHPRIDRVVLENKTGVISVITGSESVTPAAPDITSGYSPVAQILLDTTTTAITNDLITDERDFGALTVGGFGTKQDISSASTCDVGTIGSHNVNITGTTTISSFGSSANTLSPLYFIQFAASLTLTNSTALQLPGSTDIQTQAGDTAFAEYLGSGNWRFPIFQRATGLPLFSRTKTRQILTSGTTYNRPDGCTRIEVRMNGGGGGGGGGGSGASPGATGTAGGNTSFNGIVAKGGAGGAGAGTSTLAAVGTPGTGIATLRRPGQVGGFGFVAGGNGGSSPFGGAGAAGIQNGTAAAANSGSGGGGAGATNLTSSGAAGGSAGEYAEIEINNPDPTYPIAIGAGGNGASGSYVGGNGAFGIIIVDEYY
ncbi:MAG: hypothetical protein J0H19_18740 [Rhodospirillales bacterium]|nr:hypothetical protein [Rhodospirillales bacterium]